MIKITKIKKIELTGLILKEVTIYYLLGFIPVYMSIIENVKEL